MDRDRLILSKGHACPVLYAVLGKRGYMNTAKAGNLRALDSMLQGHPDMNKTPGRGYDNGIAGQRDRHRSGHGFGGEAFE